MPSLSCKFGTLSQQPSLSYTTFLLLLQRSVVEIQNPFTILLGKPMLKMSDFFIAPDELSIWVTTQARIAGAVKIGL